MRTWIGVFAPDEIKEAIRGVQKDLKKSGLPLRWVDPSIAHLNLKFLGGAVNGDNLPQVKSEIEAIAGEFSAISLFTGDIKLGFNPDRPRVLYWGLVGDLAGYKKLTTTLEERVGQLVGFRENRDSIPHVTVARVKRRLRMRDKKMISKIASKYSEQDGVMFEVDKLLLIESILSSDGPSYKQLASFPL